MSFAKFLIRFFNCWVLSFIYILDDNSLSDTEFANIFSHSSLSSHVLHMVFCRVRVLNFDKLWFWCQVLWILCLKNFYILKVYPYVIFKSSIVLRPVFKPIIHFELILVQDVRFSSKFNFFGLWKSTALACVEIQVTLPPLHYFGNFKHSCSYLCGSISGFPLQFHLSGSILLLPSIKFFSFWQHCLACKILIPKPRIEPVSLAVKARSPNHSTAREFPTVSWLR